MEEVETRKVYTNKRNAQDKIDGILTNKWVGLPIFALIMWFVFWLSQASLGPWLAEAVLTPVIDSIGEIISGWMALPDVPCRRASCACAS